jgi:biofilm regulator BssS
MAEDIPVFPIAGWDVGPLKDGSAVLLRLRYMATPQELPEDAHQGLMHVLSPEQAIELGQELLQLGTGTRVLFTRP